MAARVYTLGDAPTPPAAWLDAQDASKLAYDAATNRVASWAFKGANAANIAALTPYTAATAPLYNPTGFNSALPAVTFSSSRFDLLATASQFGVNQPATGVYVWQEPAATRSSYEVVLDHGNANGGNNQTIFGVYGGTTPIFVKGNVNNSETSSVQIPHQVNNPLGQINILVIEYNGSTSRIFFNGVMITTAMNINQSLNFGTTLFAPAGGLQIGGKKGDNPTAFNGAYCEFAIYPVIFGAGDTWDRITQGTMWKWQQQAKIPAGATYKSAAPMVDDAGGTTASGTGAAVGSGTATGGGASTATGAGSAAGTGGAAGAGGAIVVGTGVAAGSSTATGDGSAIVTSTGSTIGTSTATAPGSSIATGTGSAAGTGTAQASADGSTVIAATGTASGASTVQGVGAATFRGTGSAAGSGIVTGAGGAVIASTGMASGAATVTGTGRATFVGTGSAMGSSTANGLVPIPAQTAPPLARNVVFADTVARITALADKGTRAVSLN